MRLNPFDTSKIDVRGGGGGAGGKLGCGAIVIAILGAVFFGLDPMTTLSTIGSVQESTGSSQSDVSEEELCSQNTYSREACSALQSLNETWAPEFREAGVEFRQPSLTFYSGGVRSTARRTSASTSTPASTTSSRRCRANRAISLGST